MGSSIGDVMVLGGGVKDFVMTALKVLGAIEIIRDTFLALV